MTKMAGLGSLSNRPKKWIGPNRENTAPAEIQNFNSTQPFLVATRIIPVSPTAHQLNHSSHLEWTIHLLDPKKINEYPNNLFTPPPTTPFPLLYLSALNLSNKIFKSSHPIYTAYSLALWFLKVPAISKHLLFL